MSKTMPSTMVHGGLTLTVRRVAFYKLKTSEGLPSLAGQKAVSKALPARRGGVMK